MEVIDMRLERISSNTFKIFLTFEDLDERGLSADLMLDDFSEMDDSFEDMMIEASDELNVDLSGYLTVDIFMIKAVGMLIIVTNEDVFDEGDFIEFQLTGKERTEFLYVFEDFEAIIQFSKLAARFNIDSGSIYFYQDKYYLYFTEQVLADLIKEDLVALLSEYASRAVTELDVLLEYGQTIMTGNAMQQVRSFFKP